MLFYNQHNAIHSLQQRNTVDFGLWSCFSSFERKGSKKTLQSASGKFRWQLGHWSCHKEEFLDNHLPRARITPKQQGTFEKREKVLSSFGAQDTDSRGYEVSDLEDIESVWENPAVDINSVYRPGIVKPFSPFILDDFRWDQPLPTQY